MKNRTLIMIVLSLLALLIVGCTCCDPSVEICEPGEDICTPEPQKIDAATMEQVREANNRAQGISTVDVSEMCYPTWVKDCP